MENISTNCNATQKNMMNWLNKEFKVTSWLVNILMNKVYFSDNEKKQFEYLRDEVWFSFGEAMFAADDAKSCIPKIMSKIDLYRRIHREFNTDIDYLFLRENYDYDYTPTKLDRAKQLQNKFWLDHIDMDHRSFDAFASLSDDEVNQILSLKDNIISKFWQEYWDSWAIPMYVWLDLDWLQNTVSLLPIIKENLWFEKLSPSNLLYFSQKSESDILNLSKRKDYFQEYFPQNVIGSDWVSIEPYTIRLLDYLDLNTVDRLVELNKKWIKICTFNIVKIINILNSQIDENKKYELIKKLPYTD